MHWCCSPHLYIYAVLFYFNLYDDGDIQYQKSSKIYLFVPTRRNRFACIPIRGGRSPHHTTSPPLKHPPHTTTGSDSAGIPWYMAQQLRHYNRHDTGPPRWISAGVRFFGNPAGTIYYNVILARTVRSREDCPPPYAAVRVL